MVPSHRGRHDAGSKAPPPSQLPTPASVRRRLADGAAELRRMGGHLFSPALRSTTLLLQVTSLDVVVTGVEGCLAISLIGCSAYISRKTGSPARGLQVTLPSTWRPCSLSPVTMMISCVIFAAAKPERFVSAADSQVVWFANAVVYYGLVLLVTTVRLTVAAANAVSRRRHMPGGCVGALQRHPCMPTAFSWHLKQRTCASELCATLRAAAHGRRRQVALPTRRHSQSDAIRLQRHLHNLHRRCFRSRSDPHENLDTANQKLVFNILS